MTNTFQIAEHTIGTNHPCFIIAEVAQAHDGSLGAAHAYIDAVAKTGANAIKFQTHIAAAESTAGEPFGSSSHAKMQRATTTGSGWSLLRSNGPG